MSIFDEVSVKQNFDLFFKSKEKKENKFSFQDIFYDFCQTEKLIQNLFLFFGFSNGKYNSLCLLFEIEKAVELILREGRSVWSKT